ncbi:hypothetical protein J1C67_14605 [Clostridium gasigenes]|uniref:hypothetical protein n=1 Tax=Clostridium gasigenes TaxID=94869 RepID=UPI0014385956|nr:hypothetical protein [Clostridium gasigenes]NKF05314.1 hypothetical protein [Clostridium gasigenes]QSW18767.1 hypothetical protein J1C67_14605 [Clostridium gasigenes]
MKFLKNRIIRKIIIFNVFLLGGGAIIYFYQPYIFEKIMRYISYKTINFNFKDLLSITITILAIIIGLMITIATVLISMCEQRTIRIISELKDKGVLLRVIKKSVLFGILTEMSLGIVYIQADFNIIKLRIFILYLTCNFLLLFILYSNSLIDLLNKLLHNVVENSNQTDEVPGIFIKPNEQKDK